MARQGLSVAEVAAAMGLAPGSRHMLRDIIANRAKLPLARLDLLAEALGVPALDLLRLYLQQYEPQLYPKLKGGVL